MELNHTQKNFLKKNYRRYSLTVLAQKTETSEKVIEEYLKKHLRKETFKKLFGKKAAIKEDFKKHLFSINIRSLIQENWWVFLLLAVFVIFSYVNALFAAFVSDDKGIVENVSTFQFIFSQSVSFLRPLLNFYLYSIAGMQPFIFRLPNIGFHIGTVWLVFLMLTIVVNKKVGILTALLFAVHPILTESITWISGGVYTQYAFFFLLSFLCYILSPRGKFFYIASVIAFICSLWSSDKAIVFVGILIVYEFALGDLKKNWVKLIPYTLLSFLYIFVYMGKLGQRVAYLQNEAQQEAVTYNPLIQVPISITSYFELILWPAALTLYHSELVFSQIAYLIRLVIFLIFVGSTMYCYKKNRIIFFLALFFMITLLPTLNPFGLSWVVAERYVYLGSIGIFAIISMGIAYLSERKKIGIHVYTVFAILIFLLTIRTIIRNIDWQNEDNLWFATAQTSPSSPNTHNNLGDVYGRRGDVQNAAKEFKKAIKLKPNYADAYHNLGNAYRDMGKIDDAIKQYEKAASINPGLWQSYQNIAIVYFQQGKYDKAISYMQKAISVNPRNTALYTNLGIVYYKSGNTKRAKELFLSVLKAEPENQAVKQALLEMQLRNK